MPTLLVVFALCCNCVYGAYANPARNQDHRIDRINGQWPIPGGPEAHALTPERAEALRFHKHMHGADHGDYRRPADMQRMVDKLKGANPGGAEAVVKEQVAQRKAASKERRMRTGGGGLKLEDLAWMH